MSNYKINGVDATYEEMTDELNEQALKLQSRYLLLKEEAASVKKNWELAVDRLQAFIKRHREKLPLFDRNGETKAEPPAMLNNEVMGMVTKAVEEVKKELAADLEVKAPEPEPAKKARKRKEA